MGCDLSFPSAALFFLRWRIHRGLLPFINSRGKEEKPLLVQQDGWFPAHIDPSVPPPTWFPLISSISGCPRISQNLPSQPPPGLLHHILTSQAEDPQGTRFVVFAGSQELTESCHPQNWDVVAARLNTLVSWLALKLIWLAGCRRRITPRELNEARLQPSRCGALALKYFGHQEETPLTTRYGKLQDIF